MKKIIKIVQCIICLIIGMNLLLAGCLYYATNCKKTIRDTSVSQDGRYELTLIEIGEPAWPFGPASGRLVLNEGDSQISQTDFELHNDGCSISSGCWAVNWNEDRVEVILSGEEQFDEQILLYFDGTTQRQSLTDETEWTATQPTATQPTATQPEVEIRKLDTEVMENRENELVFTVSIEDFIESYNGFCSRSYLSPSSQWQCVTYDASIHSDHKTKCCLFSEDYNIHTMPTITAYVPTNADYIQEITVDFDEHAYSEQGHDQFEQMCFYTLKVFFPEMEDEKIIELYTQAHVHSTTDVFSSEEWYARGSVPRVLFYRDGIAVYPYFAVGDWAHLCIIPVTQASIEEFEQQGVEIHQIE